MVNTDKLTIFGWDRHIPTESGRTQFDRLIIKINTIMIAELASRFEHFRFARRVRLSGLCRRCREQIIEPFESKAEWSAHLDFGLLPSVALRHGEDLNTRIISVGNVQLARFADADVRWLIELTASGASGADLVLVDELLVEDQDTMLDAID